MNDYNHILNSIFFPRPTFKPKDENDHLVEVEKDTFVSVRFFLKNNTFPTILFFHGNAELSNEYDEIALQYNKNELNFIVADYRGYGYSSGSPTKDNLHSDSKIIFSYVRSYLIENNYLNKKIIMGRSLGSASASEIISNHKFDIDGCIIESGFATEVPLMNILGVTPKDIGYKAEYGFENLKKISIYDGPLFIIHADQDDIIPLDEAKLIYNNSNSNQKELWVIDNANHNNILMYTQSQYFIRIKAFIDKL
tara:strand:+ start:546 stop:1301 length:756 start_codon:yes stop_codon:yes gene_type:complete